VATRQSTAGWTGNHNAGRHFFTWLHLYDAHSPYYSPEPFRGRYAGRPYDGAIAFDDEQVGGVVARLRALNVYDNTLVVLLSDHGESLGEHGESEHGFFVYNATLRVPLIVKLPVGAVHEPPLLREAPAQRIGPSGGTARGRVVSEPVVLVDVAPTIGAVAKLCWLWSTLCARWGGEVNRLISARRANAQERKHIVTIKLDPAKPRLTRKQRAEIAVLAKMRDREIDYSDIPPIPAWLLERAVRSRLHRRGNRQLSVRIDADVLVWSQVPREGLPRSPERYPAFRHDRRTPVLFLGTLIADG